MSESAADEGRDTAWLVVLPSLRSNSCRPAAALSGARDRLFDRVREVVDTTGVLKGRRRRVLDSTVFADVVATQDAVTQLAARVPRACLHTRAAALNLRRLINLGLDHNNDTWTFTTATA